MRVAILNSYSFEGKNYKVVCSDRKLYEVIDNSFIEDIGDCDECPKEYCSGLLYDEHKLYIMPETNDGYRD